MVFSFGKFLKLNRKESGFPIRRVASNLKIDTSTYRKIERSERSLSVKLMQNLTEVLETEGKEIVKHFYSHKIVELLKNYPDYSEVFSLTNNI